MDYENLRLDHQLCFPLYTASRLVLRLYKPLLDPLNLTYTQYIVLLALWETDHQTVSELGEKLYLDSGTLTPLLKKLEQAGYVERRRKTADERSVVISLTASGSDLKQVATEIPKKLAGCIHLPEKDAKDLHRILHSILNQSDAHKQVISDLQEG